MPFSSRTTACLCLALAGCSRLASLSEDEPEHFTEGFAELQHTKLKKVDILIVLDNSSSMASVQDRMQDNFRQIVEVLEAEDVDADYRIAITTTDAGHPACTSSTPEHGELMLTPCTSRLDEFVADGEGGPSDVRALACSDTCTLGDDALAILPTTTQSDPIAKPRPWIERGPGGTNLPPSTDMGEALACLGPQGVAGCDFESPLDAMAQAIERVTTPGDPAYGFIRADAVLLVVVITDEDDCSLAEHGAEIFALDGDKLFWSDPGAAAPTSAVCWNAGVSCVGDPSGYDSCDPVNKDLAGNEGVADIDAVLHPPSRYIALLDAIADDKPTVTPWDPGVLFVVVGGARSDGHLEYGDVTDTDPGFQTTFGIGPGCTAPGPEQPIRAIPPTRLAAVTDAFSPSELGSICDPSWYTMLSGLSFVSWSGPQLPPPCFPHCVLDTNDSTLALEPDCIVEEEDPDGSIRRIEECARDETGYLVDSETSDYQLPSDDVHVCYAARTDDSQLTPESHDDMSPECTERGMNLEFRIARRPGHPAVGNSRIDATCLLSPTPSISCPSLDG